MISKLDIVLGNAYRKAAANPALKQGDRTEEHKDKLVCPLGKKCNRLQAIKNCLRDNTCHQVTIV